MLCIICPWRWPKCSQNMLPYIPKSKINEQLFQWQLLICNTSKHNRISNMNKYVCLQYSWKYVVWGKNCHFCKNKCQQPHTDDSYDWKVSLLDNKTIQKTLFIIDEALLTWSKNNQKKIIYYGVPKTPYCSGRHTVQPWGWSMVCS
jgi:hypothetical protein